MPLTRRRLVVCLAAGASALAPVRASAAAPWRDTAVADPATGRRIGLRIRLPAADTPAALILYSPGLGSGLGNGAAWCEAWRAAGCVVVTLSHPVTNEAIWSTQRRSFADNLAAALAAGQYPARVADIRFVIGKCLSGLGIEHRIDAARIGVAGHSYGAITVQTLAVEAARGSGRAGEIKAAVALSPGVVAPEQAARMAAARLPFFCVTGDHDNTVTFTKDGTARRLGVPLANRLAVYAGLPRGARQLLVLSGADHMSFAGEPVDARRFSRDVAASEAASEAVWTRVSSATTAFWRHYLSAPGSERPARQAYLAGIRAGLLARDRLEAD
ncbi:MAG: hypothetical protein NW223_18815 [Hyphomicrobiaceae bacterium]|nr:hypothetical protein [Hyphomicrobiaceae bacterium]